MAAAAMTSQTRIKRTEPVIGLAGLRVYGVSGQAAVNNDWITVPELNTIYGAYMIASDGTAATYGSFATNKIVISNAGTKLWTGIAWGLAADH